MKKNRIFVICTAVLVLLIFGLSAWWTGKSEKSSTLAEPAIDHASLVRPHSPVKGNLDAKVTIVEFLDPECEACRAMHPIVKRLMTEYGDNVRLVIRYMPLHGNSKLAAVALEEAREQGKYDDALDILFERQPEWADHGHPRADLIPVLLAEVGIDKSTLEFSQLLSKHGSKVEMDQLDGQKLGVRLTPTFFVNGEMLNEIGYEPVKQAIEKHLNQ